MQLNVCKCGGIGVYVGGGMVDSYGCTSCDYRTGDYFDGAAYAVDEWNKRNPPGTPNSGSSDVTIDADQTWKPLYGFVDPPPAPDGHKIEYEYDAVLGAPISYRYVPIEDKPAELYPLLYRHDVGTLEDNAKQLYDKFVKSWKPVDFDKLREQIEDDQAAIVRVNAALRSSIALLSAFSSDAVTKTAIEELQFVQKFIEENV